MGLNKYKIILLTISLFFCLSCEKNVDRTGFFTPDILSISTFLEKNKEEYSMYYQIMQYADLYFTLNAYNPNGNGFTLFLPSDEAFNKYIENSDKYASFDDLLKDSEFIWLLSRYHLLNSSTRSSEFTYGALPDSTATGDYLTISFDVSEDTTIYRVNNISPIKELDIETINGYIHVLENVLEPISYNSYEWLKAQEGFSIISEAFEITGLLDVMGNYRTTESGELIKNSYTVFAEHDSIFHRSGIMNTDDLIQKYSTPGLDYTDPQNILFQFASYHILEGSYFLDEFTGSGNYNSYAIYPVSINSGLEIEINAGVDTFGLEIIGADTTIVDYISLFYQQSNVNTRNGPVHFISQVMELYKPARSERTFQFLEEPQINSKEDSPGVYEFFDPEHFELIWWEGPERIKYTKLSGSDGAELNMDFLTIEGSFTIKYTMPKILPGLYRIELGVQRRNSANATIQIFIDGKRIGSNFNLTSGGSGSDPYYPLDLGEVDFDVYEGHEIVIKSLIPGILKWDYVRFLPE